MNTKIELITPEIAKMYLSRNLSNRPLRQKTVNYYAEQMRGNLWRLTGQGISFDSSNKLIDGQHRLAAIVKANKPIEMLVITGIEANTFDVYDTGKNRSSSDVFSINNVKNATKAAALITSYLALKKGTNTTVRAKENNITNHLIYETYLLYKNEVDEAIQIAACCYAKFKLFSATQLGAFILFKNVEIGIPISRLKNYLYQLHTLSADEFPCTQRFREFVIKNKMDYRKIPTSDLTILLFYNYDYWTRGLKNFPIGNFDLTLKTALTKNYKDESNN